MRPTESRSCRCTLSRKRKLVNFIRTRSETGDQQDAFRRSYRRREQWYRLIVLRVGPFADEHQVDRTSGARLACVHQHVHSGGVAILEADRSACLDDRLQDRARSTATSTSRVEAGCQRIAFVDVQEHRDTSDDAILDACLGKRARDAVDRIEELLRGDRMR